MLPRLALCFFIAAVAFIASLQHYAHTVRIDGESLPPLAQPQNSIGIVVATGSAGRIAQGIKVAMEVGNARLLISGIGTGVSKSDIKRIVLSSPDNTISAPDLDARLACCIDLGASATNTKGNATEAGAWAKSQNFDSIILVTSDFHLPRAVRLFNHYLDGIKVIPHAFATPWLQPSLSVMSDFWLNPRHISIIAAEMVKYWLSFIF